MPSVVAIDGASVPVNGYVVVPLEVAGTEIAHPLLVVRNLSCPLRIGTDILRPHEASVSVMCGDSDCLGVRVCDVCRECWPDPRRGERIVCAGVSSAAVCASVPSQLPYQFCRAAT